MSYNYNPEAVIDHVLQEDLLPHLRHIDQSLSSLPSNRHKWSSIGEAVSSNQIGELEKEGISLDQAVGGGDSGYHGDSLLDQRSSIYDHDEFDVFRRKDVDQSRIHVGKK